jgi:tetratricopeptide (TPR) repeat protein
MKANRLLSRPDWLLAIALLTITLLAYSPGWNGKPIWDDDQHLTKPELRSWNGLEQIWTNVGITHQYYPVVHTVFWIEQRLWGDRLLYYHLVNILLHSGAALLLVSVVRQLKLPGSWVAGALFALHPIQVESVAWMSELKNTLSATFCLSSALLYLKFDRTRSRSTFLVALGLFVLGLLSKSVICVLPVAILIVLWWKRRQLVWKRDVLPLLPFFAIGISAGLFTTWVERHFVGAEGIAFNLSVIDRILIAGRAFWFYLWKLFWPAKLTFVYPRWDIDEAVWWQYLFPAGAFLLFAILFLLRRRLPGTLSGFLFFAVMLFPALGFFNVYPFIYSFVADHFQYFASIGIITTTSAGLTTLVDHAGWRPQTRVILFSSLCATLAFLTWRQAHMYRDEETLWRTTLSRNPDSSMANTNLGALLMETGRPDEAIPHYERALAHRKVDPEHGHYNLAVALFKIGQIDGAIAHYQKALELKPGFPQAHYQLGRALLKKGEINDAIRQYKEALKLRPNEPSVENDLGSALMQEGLRHDAIEHYEAALQVRENDADIQYNLANALAKDGQIDKAIVHYRRALSIQPEHVEAGYELGSALLQKGRTDEAIASYQKVLRMRPDHVNAHTNLGNLLLQKGELAEAIAQYEKAIELAPEDNLAEINLAWALATCPDSSLRNGKKAVALAQDANQRLGGNDPLALRSLAAAYAEIGEFPSAVQAAKEGWQIAFETENQMLMKALSTEMESYTANLPYRQ